VDTNLRKFRREDADTVVALALQAYLRPEEQVGNPVWRTRAELESEVSDWDPPATDTLLVAEEGGEVVGIGGVEAGAGSPVADLFGPVVAKRAQGRRLGSRLLVESIALARAHGASALDAAVGTRNRRGRVLLESNGFARRGGAQAFYELRPQDHRPAAPAPNDLTVRLAGPADAEPVLALYRECFPDHRRFPEGWVRAGLEDGIVHVAELKGSPVAFLTIDRADRWIYLVGVTADARGRGVGGILLSRALEAYWTARPGEALGLATGADNAAAVRLYRRQGFRPTLLLQPYELLL
jgi:ribosomal protein S18 acetylase RimI-like enzyme